MCLILGYGGYLVYIDTDNTFTIGKLIEFMSYFGSCIWPMMAISMLVDLSSRGKASLNRISEYLIKMLLMLILLKVILNLEI